jgi:lipopolysaccharide assembly protein A
MRFLKILFWVMILVAAAIFSWNNWTPVTINLWDGLVLDTKLPVLLITAFLIGLIPYFLIHRATRWSLRRKLDSAERNISDLKSTTVPLPPPPVEERIAESSAMPPVGAPIAVPPGVA